MNEREDFWKRFVLAMICIACLVCVFAGQNFRKSYSFFSEGIEEFNSGWNIDFLTFEGTMRSRTVMLPLNLSYSPEEGLRIRNVIPQDVQGNQYLFVASYHQDIEIYIGGESRMNYNTKEERPFGLTSPRVTLMVPLSAEDAGKIIEIRYHSYYQKYQNYIQSIFLGTQSQFFYFLIENHWTDMVTGVAFVGLGFIFLVASFVLRYRYYLSTNVNYLGYFAFMNGLWILLNSEARQIYLNDMFSADKISYMMMALYCIPCLMFLNSKQNGRYKNSNIVMCFLLIVNYLVLLALDAFNVVDIVISQIMIYGMILITYLYAVFVFALDIKRKKWKSEAEIMIAFTTVAISMIMKIVEYNYNGSEGYFSKPLLYFSVLFMVIVMGTGNLRGWYTREREIQRAINANEAKTMFLANMSHEIRTPISAILGMNEMIIRESESVSVQNYAHKIKNAGAILVSLVNDILDISKIESGKMELVEKEYDVTGLLGDVINMSAIRAENKNLEFKTKISEKIPRRLYGDDLRIRQIMNNILSNAVKYTNKGTVVLQITMEETEINEETGEEYGLIKVQVSDTGVGIREEDISKLTESFVRFDEVVHHNVEGTGLGMAITSKYLSMMNSKLEISSIYGRGSKFGFVLSQKIIDKTPIGNYYDTAYKSMMEQKEREEKKFIAPKAKILVVDDNEINLEVIVGLLKELKVQVTSVTGGYQALEMTKTTKFDLVFMDHMMPVMDGIETLHRLRELENGKSLPIVVLTANAIEGAREEYLKEGFTDYLVKPILVDELEKVIRSNLPEEYIEKPFSKRIQKSQEGVLQGEVKKLEENMERILIRYGINAKEGIRYSAGKLSNYKLMLKAYLGYDEERRKKFGMSIIEKKTDVYTVEAHALKGNAKGIGAGNLSQLAYNHEKESREGNLEYLEKNFPELLREMNRTVEGVKVILEML